MNRAQIAEALRLIAIIEPELPDVTEREGVWCCLRGGDARAVHSLLRTLAEQQEPAPHAMQQLTAALQADPDYAWSWHCNLAMPVMDATGVTHRTANEAGARLMRHLFDIDITKHPHYAAPVAQPLTVTEAMVDAYLRANTLYWRSTDEIQCPPGKWRTGSVGEATRVSLEAALAAAGAKP
jgi:hypothetical protein